MTGNKYLDLLWLMRNEWRSPEDMIAVQNRKLRILVRHAYDNVAFYRDRFKRVGLTPDDVQSIHDIEKIPIIDKFDMHQWDYAGLIDRRVKDRHKLIPISTSGSSGLSLRFYVDRQYEQLRKAQYLRPYLTNGRRPTDTVLRFSTTAVPSARWFQRLGLMREYKIYSNSDLDRQIDLLATIKPQIVQGYPSLLTLLAKRILEEKIAIPQPRMVFTDSELLTPQARLIIKQAFGGRIVDVFGTLETENIAYECAKQKGYHIAQDIVIMEFIKDGAKVKSGKEGELVCTVLDNFNMPFIRYNLHDVGIYTETPCSCGRTFPLMTVMAGRSDDYIACVGGGKKSPRTILGLFYSLAGSIHEYQIIQQTVLLFEVLVVPGCTFNSGTEERIKANIASEFPNAVVQIRLVDAIQRSRSGKFKAFVSKLS